MSQPPLIEIHAKTCSPHLTGGGEYACCLFADRIRNDRQLQTTAAVLYEVFDAIAYYQYVDSAVRYEFHFPMDVTCRNDRCVTLKHTMSLAELMSRMDEEAEEKKKKEEEEASVFDEPV